jgi:tol-pal system-associated acyl-CoA thioesterase
MAQRFPVTVYYEDTDCMGLVYHANYLKFLERARTEYMQELGSSVMAWAEKGIMFPIYSVQVTFRAPARLGDKLSVLSEAKRLTQFRMQFTQKVERPSDGRMLVEAVVDVVCTDLQGNLRDMPDLGFAK